MKNTAEFYEAKALAKIEAISERMTLEDTRLLISAAQLHATLAHAAAVCEQTAAMIAHKDEPQHFLVNHRTEAVEVKSTRAFNRPHLEQIVQAWIKAPAPPDDQSPASQLVDMLVEALT